MHTLSHHINLFTDFIQELKQCFNKYIMIYSYVSDKNKLLLDVVVQFVVHNKVSQVLKSKILSHNQHS